MTLQQTRVEPAVCHSNEAKNLIHNTWSRISLFTTDLTESPYVQFIFTRIQKQDIPLKKKASVFRCQWHVCAASLMGPWDLSVRVLKTFQSDWLVLGQRH